MLSKWVKEGFPCPRALQSTTNRLVDMNRQHLNKMETKTLCGVRLKNARERVGGMLLFQHKQSN